MKRRDALKFISGLALVLPTGKNLFTKKRHQGLTRAKKPNSTKHAIGWDWDGKRVYKTRRGKDRGDGYE